MQKRLIEAVQYQYFWNCSSLNILQHKRYIRTTNLYVYCVKANSKDLGQSILGWSQTSNLVLTLNKRKIYFVYVQMYQNVKNTWGYLISMTYRRRNCEKSSSFKWSWLSWICFHTTCSLSVERKEEPVAKVGSHVAGEGCLGGGLLSLLWGRPYDPSVPWLCFIPATKQLRRASCQNRWPPVSAWWLGRFDDSLPGRRGGQAGEIWSSRHTPGLMRMMRMRSLQRLGTFTLQPKKGMGKCKSYIHIHVCVYFGGC